MKIAILSTPWISTPPQGYGGTELVVHNLTEELVKRGHDVTLFATGDSKTSAKLKYAFRRALGAPFKHKKNPYNKLLFHVREFIHLVEKENFDIIHAHTRPTGLFLLDYLKKPFLHTLHGAFYKGANLSVDSVVDIRKALLKFKNHFFVKISEAQSKDLPKLNYIRCIFNGVATNKYRLGKGSGGYLAWLGRITSIKGPDIAIKIAQLSGQRLEIAGIIEDRNYFNKEIKPYLNGRIKFIGELKSISEKSKFLGDAKALLFPVRIRESFGMVMAEAMATGTPVIGTRIGSVPEVIKDGQTGFVVKTKKEMLEKVGQIKKLNRKLVRSYAEENFSVKSMVDKYEEVYEKVLKKVSKPNGHSRQAFLGKNAVDKKRLFLHNEA